MGKVLRFSIFVSLLLVLFTSAHLYEVVAGVNVILCQTSLDFLCYEENPSIEVALAIGKHSIDKLKITGMHILMPNWMFVQTREKKDEVGPLDPTSSFFSRV